MCWIPLDQWFSVFFGPAPQCAGPLPAPTKKKKGLLLLINIIIIIIILIKKAKQPIIIRDTVYTWCRCPVHYSMRLRHLWQQDKLIWNIPFDVSTQCRDSVRILQATFFLSACLVVNLWYKLALMATKIASMNHKEFLQQT